MKKKVAILGSTGSIGESTLIVFKKDKKNFDVVFLSAKNNYKKQIEQAKEFKVKNVFIKNKSFYKKTKKGLKNTKRVMKNDDDGVDNKKETNASLSSLPPQQHDEDLCCCICFFMSLTNNSSNLYINCNIQQFLLNHRHT